MNMECAQEVVEQEIGAARPGCAGYGVHSGQGEPPGGFAGRALG